MTKKAVRTLIASSMVVAALAVAGAASPIFWHTSTRADFARGEIENLSVDAEGRLLLGPAMPPVHESAAPFLWSVQTLPDGTMFIGSGNDGKVFRLAPGGESSVFFDAPELEAHALALAEDGTLYVGTSPEGRIYKVDRAGKSTVFFDPPDKYIWALALDDSGRLYAGTGDKGVIYRVTPDGKGSVLYETRATNVLSFAFDEKGNLLAGTESPGRVFRIDPSGKPFVVLDSAFREIRSVLTLADGTVYAAAVGARGDGDRLTARPGTERPAAAVPSVTAEITSMSVVEVGVTAAPAQPAVSTAAARGPARGAVYRLDPDGTSEIVWDSPDDLPYDVAENGRQEVIVGTGNKGRIFRVAAGDPPRVTLVGRVGAQQVTSLVPGREGKYLILTANPGKVFLLSEQQAEEGSFESEVRDAKTVSSWGTISWRATVPEGSTVEVTTRSGNSEKPDDTWSAWSKPYSRPDGQQVTSPAARFLQWKAVFRAKGDETPVLTSVSIAYLQRNLRPRLQSVTVHPAGTVFQRPFSTTGEIEIAGYDQPLDTRPPASPAQGQSASASTGPSPTSGRRIYQKGLQTFTWSASDNNDDELRYDVHYRREGETEWKVLKRELVDPILVWDTTAVPNGTYEVRVRASDSPSNVPGSALTGELTSTTFDIDNTPPVIRVAGIRKERDGQVLAVEVRDDQSVVARVDYSVDAERWRPIHPLDGMADSRVERFEIYFPGTTLPASIVLRATDAMHNVSTLGGISEALTDGERRR